MLDKTPFETLLRAERILQGGGSAFGSARAGIEADLSRWIAGALADGIAPGDLWQLVRRLSPMQIDKVLTGAREGALARLYEAARPHIAEERLDITRLSTPALDRLIADGYSYEYHLERETGAFVGEAWLARGAAYGETAFRARFPRKSPVVAFWEEKGLSLPPLGLSPDGLALVARELRRAADKQLPRSVLTPASRNANCADWRVVLCLHMTLASVPPEIARLSVPAFGARRAKSLRPLFVKAGSSHHEIERVRLLRTLPEIEEILAMKRDLSDLDRILDKLLAKERGARGAPGDQGGG